MFLGRFFRTIDTKNRITVPSAFKDELRGGAFMTQGFDRNVQVLTAEAFKEVYRRAAAQNIADPLARLLRRLVLGTALEVRPERGNAIGIPDYLKEYAGLGEDAILVGQGDYFEIWSPEMWGKQEALLKEAEANSGRFASLSLSTR